MSFPIRGISLPQKFRLFLFIIYTVTSAPCSEISIQSRFVFHFHCLCLLFPEYFLLLLHCPIHIRFRQRMSCLHISHLPASGTDLIYCCLPCYLNYCRHHCLNFLPEHNYPQGNQAQRLLKSQLSAHLLQPVLHKHPHRLPPALHIL